jgi:DNA mismatch repair protein MutS2
MRIAVYAGPLEDFHRIVINLECLRSKARYSHETRGNFAHAPEDPPDALVLKQARHPMIPKAVPIDLSMNPGIRTLIITGPNTGGKTVALKTLGLFALMNQSGLALPANEGSVLPVFDGVYADIGDEQSIKQSLSTFSAHISNIANITENAGEKSLVLLDELGSGTDPQEGGALAMALLDFLIEKKSRMIITTHHGILKNYGYTRQGVENASVEFDGRTLSPTYKIINGIPGESRALDIALRNGLTQNIVDAAKKYLEGEQTDVSSLIRGLKEKHQELAELEKKSRGEEKRLRETRRDTDLKELRLRQKEVELKQNAAGKLRLLLDESRKTLENLVREIREGELTREKTIKVKEFLSDLAKNVENENEILNDEEAALGEELRGLQTAGAANPEFFPGMEVFAGPSKQRGIIVRLDKKTSSAKKGNTWVVETGSLKIAFHERDLIPAPRKTSPSAAHADWAAELIPSAGAVLELKLIGMRLDEALQSLERQIEAAAISGLKTFAVVHGKGNGILQKGVHEYLKKDPAVQDYYFSRPELGGFGRTEVVLR